MRCLKSNLHRQKHAHLETKMRIKFVSVLFLFICNYALAGVTGTATPQGYNSEGENEAEHQSASEHNQEEAHESDGDD